MAGLYPAHFQILQICMLAERHLYFPLPISSVIGFVRTAFQENVQPLIKPDINYNAPTATVPARKLELLT